MYGEGWKRLCCPCFTQEVDSKSSSESFYGLNYDDEPTEYVVEKLAVKRVPIRLIETDTHKIKTESDEAPFRSYYAKMGPSTSKKNVGTQTLSKESVISLEEPLKMVPPPAQLDKSFDEPEQDLLTKILNTLSTLHTLDPKKKIPKDPLPVNPPKKAPDAPVVIPEHIIKRIALQKQNIIMRQARSRKGGDKAKVLFQSGEQNPPPNTEGAPRHPITPELQQTLDALGITSTKQSDTKMAKEWQLMELKPPVESPIYLGQAPESAVSLENPPVEIIKDVKRKTESATDEDTSEMSIANNEGSDEHITEISQLKGQNLKWKIIIKHHMEQDEKEPVNLLSEADSNKDI